MWKQYNPNPRAARVGDCTVRAISKATGQSWEEIYIDLCIYGLMKCDLPMANHVWGAYLKDKGYVRALVADTGRDYYTVDDFAKDHPKGTYILALSGHVVAVQDGDYYDSWDSGNEIPIYYWEEKK